LPDSKLLFDSNWGNKKARALLVSNGYYPETVISYSTDQYGLRNEPSVDIHNSILTLGCSFTFGTGLHKSDTWPSLLEQRTGRSVYNAGLPGSSNDTSFRLVANLVPRYQPLAVVLLSTFSQRREFYDDNNKAYYNYNELTQDHGATYVNTNHSQKFSITNHKDNSINYVKNICAIGYICQTYDIPFVYQSVDNVSPIPQDLARDLQHPGKKTHQIVAEQMHLLLDNQ